MIATARPFTNALFMGVFLLAGCAADDLAKHKHHASADPMQVEAGSLFTLAAPLMFSQGSAVLYFQDNQLVSASGVTQDDPYCKLVPNNADTPRVIDPATFAVQSVEYDDKEISASGKAVSVTRIMLVANPLQPYTLSCRWPDGAPSSNFLTSDEILGAIGAYFTLTLQR